MMASLLVIIFLSTIASINKSQNLSMEPPTVPSEYSTTNTVDDAYEEGDELGNTELIPDFLGDTLFHIMIGILVGLCCCCLGIVAIYKICQKSHQLNLKHQESMFHDEIKKAKASAKSPSAAVDVRKISHVSITDSGKNRTASTLISKYLKSQQQTNNIIKMDSDDLDGVVQDIAITKSGQTPIGSLEPLPDNEADMDRDSGIQILATLIIA